MFVRRHHGFPVYLYRPCIVLAAVRCNQGFELGTGISGHLWSYAVLMGGVSIICLVLSEADTGEFQTIIRGLFKDQNG